VRARVRVCGCKWVCVNVLAKDGQKMRIYSGKIYTQEHPLASFPPLPSSPVPDNNLVGGVMREVRGAGGVRKRARDSDNKRQRQVRDTQDSGEGFEMKEGGRGREKEPKPKRHKEGCMEEGGWRVTECPKKPLNAYMMWFFENRQDIQQVILPEVCECVCV